MTSNKSNWLKVKFGDVVRQCKERVDRDNNPFEYYVEGGHMDSEDIHIHRWGEFGEDYVGPAFHRIFRKGQVLYGSRRTYLKKVAVAPFDGITANTTFVCETKDQKVFMQELLPFLMLTDAFTEHSIRESKGSTNPYINWPDIAKFEFPLPPINEQKRIAEILWAADEVEKRYEIVLNAATQLLQTIREANVCNKSYRRKKLSELLIKIVAGKSVTGVNSPAPSTGFGVLKVSAIGANGFVPEENKSLINAEDFLSQYSIKKDSLIITRCNTTELVGRVCITEKDYPNLMLCDKTLQLVFDPNKVNQVFIEEALKSKELRIKIMGRATGTGGAMKNISQHDIRSLSVPMPNIDAQNNIADTISNVQSQIKNIHLQIDNTHHLKQKTTNQLLHTESSCSTKTTQ